MARLPQKKSIRPAKKTAPKKVVKKAVKVTKKVAAKKPAPKVAKVKKPIKKTITQKKPIKKVISKKTVASKKPEKKGKIPKQPVRGVSPEEIQKRLEILIEKGKKRRFVTYEEILKSFPDVEDDILFLDDLYGRLHDGGEIGRAHV